MHHVTQGIVAATCLIGLILVACEKQPEPTAAPATSLDTMSSTTSGTAADPFGQTGGAGTVYQPQYTVTNVSPAPATTEYAATAPPAAPQPATAQPAPAYYPEEPLTPTRDYGYNSSGPEGRTHVVKKGESLSSIARQYYGNASEWRRIYDANRNRIQHRDRIKVGQRLIIP